MKINNKNQGEKMSQISNVEEILKQSTSLPFLFLGSGISKRYFSTENWPGLLKKFLSKLDGDVLAYEKYINKARQQLTTAGISVTKNSLMTKLADLIEDEFNTYWFESKEFEAERTTYKEEIMNGASPFKLAIANYFREIKLEDVPEKYKQEIQLLKQIGKKSIGGILTTNYDCFGELLFPDYETYVGQERLIFSPTYGINEIYKVHGCCNNAQSIVINSLDYKNFEEKNAYLAAKLMTIFVEHPIVFLGYSLDDENIQAIIKSIVDCLSEQNLDKLRDRLIFVEWNDGQTEVEVTPFSKSFANGKTISMTKVKTDSYEELFEVISKNKTKYSASFYRRLRKDIYELSLSDEPHEKIMVLPSTDERVMEENYQMLIGFGIMELGRRGYRSITTEEIFMDIIFDNGKFNGQLLITEALPDIIKKTSGSVPVFKYLNSYTGELPEQFQRYENFNFGEFVTSTIKITREGMNYTSINDVTQRNRTNIGAQIRFIQALPPRNMNVDELGEYIKKMLTDQPKILMEGKANIRSGMKKLIRMYDFLKYKK